MRRNVLLVLLLLLLIAALAGYKYYYSHREKSDELTLYGNVDVRQVDISFRVLGKVDSMPFEEGDLVRKGSLVGALERQPYEDQVKQAEAQVESLKAQLENAKINLKRRSELVGTQSVAKEDYENALYAEKQYAANLKAAEAQLGIARKNLSDTEAYTMQDGTVLTRVREPGTVLNPTEPIYTISILDPVWIRAFVDEPHLGQIYPGMPADIYTDTPDGKVYHGQVGFISPVAEFTPKTVESTSLRTDLVYRLRIYVNNPEWGLRQGMPVTVKLHLRKDGE